MSVRVCVGCVGWGGGRPPLFSPPWGAAVTLRDKRLMQTSIYSLLLPLAAAAGRRYTQRGKKERKRNEEMRERERGERAISQRASGRIAWTEERQSNTDVFCSGDDGESRLTCSLWEIDFPDHSRVTEVTSADTERWPLTSSLLFDSCPNSLWLFLISPLNHHLLSCVFWFIITKKTQLVHKEINQKSPCSLGSSPAAGRRHVWSSPSFHSLPSPSRHPHPLQLQREENVTSGNYSDPTFSEKWDTVLHFWLFTSVWALTWRLLHLHRGFGAFWRLPHDGDQRAERQTQSIRRCRREQSDSHDTCLVSGAEPELTFPAE